MTSLLSRVSGALQLRKWSAEPVGVAASGETKGGRGSQCHHCAAAALGTHAAGATPHGYRAT